MKKSIKEIRKNSISKAYKNLRKNTPYTNLLVRNVHNNNPKLIKFTIGVIFDIVNKTITEDKKIVYTGYHGVGKTLFLNEFLKPLLKKMIPCKYIQEEEESGFSINVEDHKVSFLTSNVNENDSIYSKIPLKKMVRVKFNKNIDEFIEQVRREQA